MRPERLALCPHWPAVLGVDEAILYLGGKPKRLFALIAQGYLDPWNAGHKDTDFLREEVDTALKIVRINGASLEKLPEDVKSVSAALAYRNQPSAA